MNQIPEGGQNRNAWFAALFYRNIVNTSQTAHGFELSKNKEGKPRLEITGFALGQRVKGNSYKVARAILESVERNWGIKRTLRTIVNLTHEGFPIQTRQFRRRPTEMPYGLPPDKIPEAMCAFRAKLEREIVTPKDPVALAAWVEYQIDQVIHPFGDGCGRVSKAVSAWVLMRNSVILPDYRNRDAYLKAIRAGFPEFLDYYRSCCKSANSVEERRIEADPK